MKSQAFNLKVPKSNQTLKMCFLLIRQLVLARDRIDTGLKKLHETNELVTNMEVELFQLYRQGQSHFTNFYAQTELTALAPRLEKNSRETEELMKTLTEDQKRASEVKAVVVKEEAIANKKAEETKIIADDAQKDLDQALPALRAANKVMLCLQQVCIAIIYMPIQPE